MHNFQESLSRGKKIEQQLDAIFSRWYLIETVSLETERQQGIDRIFTVDNRTIKVEYKADWWLNRTGNVFIETEVSGKPGWAIKTQADIILYAAVTVKNIINKIVIIPNEFIKQNIVEWKQQYPSRIIPNNGFNGFGYLVPLQNMDVKVLYGN